MVMAWVDVLRSRFFRECQSVAVRLRAMIYFILEPRVSVSRVHLGWRAGFAVCAAPGAGVLGFMGSEQVEVIFAVIVTFLLGVSVVRGGVGDAGVIEAKSGTG